VFSTFQAAGGLLPGLGRAERLIDLLKVVLAHLRRQLIRLSARRRHRHLPDLLAGVGLSGGAAPRCHGCASWQAERRRRCLAIVVNVSSSARVSACAGQFSTQAGPASRPAHRSHFCALAFTWPAACGVTTTCITPNGQATMQDLQPMHFS
jgi:hypothetical protein